MKKFIFTALLGLVFLSQPVMADEVPSGALKVRQSLESLRFSMAKNMVLLNLIDLTDEDQKYFSDHIPSADADSFNEAIMETVGGINSIITDLGGSSELSADEQKELLKLGGF